MQELFILPEDMAYAVKRRHELEVEIKALGPEFQDVFTQSSETWHDNAPFEAVRDKQSVLAAELAHIKKVLQAAAVSLPKAKKGRVGLGSTVTLSDGKRYKIAGDWTPRAGHKVNGVVTVSSRSPIGCQLLNKKVGEMAALPVGHSVISEIND